MKTNLPKSVIQGTYVSVWDGGIEAQSKCLINTETGEVYNIETAEIGITNLVKNLDSEHVFVNGVKHPVFEISDISEPKGDEIVFWYEC